MRTLGTLGTLVLALGLLAACSPSAQEIKTAREASYSAEYAIVWNALAATVKRDYPHLKVENAGDGVIISDWTPIERVADSSDVNFNQTGGENNGRIYFQLRARIVGKSPPFRIAIDGEAARYRPGYSSLIPWKHGQEGEPQWVRGRIDRVYVGVFDSLEAYAVRSGAAPTELAPEGTRPPDEATLPRDDGTSGAIPGNAPGNPPPPPDDDDE